MSVGICDKPVGVEHRACALISSNCVRRTEIKPMARNNRWRGTSGLHSTTKVLDLDLLHACTIIHNSRQTTSVSAKHTCIMAHLRERALHTVRSSDRQSSSLRNSIHSAD